MIKYNIMASKNKDFTKFNLEKENKRYIISSRTAPYIIIIYEN